jgi:hypothetical protein
VPRESWSTTKKEKQTNCYQILVLKAKGCDIKEYLLAASGSMIHIMQQIVCNLKPSTQTARSEIGTWKERLFAFGLFKKHQPKTVLFKRWCVYHWWYANGRLVAREKI